jgi:hypothetical protein
MICRMRIFVGSSLPELRHPMAPRAGPLKLDILCQDKARYDLLTEWMWAVVEGRQVAPARRAVPRTGVAAIAAQVWEQLTKLSAVLGKHANELGLDPSGFAKFANDTTVVQALRGARLDQAVEQGRGSSVPEGSTSDVEAPASRGSVTRLGELWSTFAGASRIGTSSTAGVLGVRRPRSAVPGDAGSVAICGPLVLATAGRRSRERLFCIVR